MEVRREIKNSLVLFFGTYGVFRTYTKFVSPRYPKLNRHLYILGRRIHHLETGMYLAALGLALFLEDIQDWKYEHDEKL